MSKIKNAGLDQYGAGPFEQQQFETAGVERVKQVYRPEKTTVSKLHCYGNTRTRRCSQRKADTCGKYLIGVWLLGIEAFVGNDLRHGQVVGIADPADGVGVLAMAVGELRGTPAVDRFTDELFGADQEPEADQNDDGVLPTQPIHVVVVHAKLYLADAQHRLEQFLHVCSSPAT